MPVIADDDAGFGKLLDAIRVVKQCEAAKIRAAVDARSSSGPILIASADARDVEGLDTAIERTEICGDSTAGLLFIEGAESAEDVETIARALHGTPLVCNWSEGGKTPSLPYDEINESGSSLLSFWSGPL